MKDRPTQSHERIFLLTKSQRYFYDGEAVKEPDSGRPSGNGFVRPERLSHGQGRDEQWRPGRGRNLRSVWRVAVRPLKEAHFASFPPALIEPCIRAGTSEAGRCSECGTPLRRVIERVDQGWDGSRYGERAVAATGGAISGGTARSTLGSSNGRLTADTRTVGWERDCDHEAEAVPCVVLDPFAGSGTTGVVACRLGRDFIGVELSPEYVEMSRRRIENDAPLFNRT